MAQRFRFRNLYAKSMAKWEDILPLGSTTDGFVVSGNSKYIAFTLGGGNGSTLGVLSYQQAGRVKNMTNVRGHTSHITDFKFIPYEENHFVTCSQDSTIKVWRVEDGNEDINAPVTTLNGHELKVNLVAPHHIARGILASSSNDTTVKIWDSLQEKNIFTVKQGSTNALALDWSHDGNLIGSTWADKQVRILDPRQQTFVREFGAHASSRAQKFAWLGNTGQFVTTGFDQVQKRQLFLWDIRNTSKHQEVAGCSQGQGILHPFYDTELGILYLNGKGESLIRFYEHQSGTLTTHMNDVMSTDTTKGYGFLPKYTNNPQQNELCRVIKLCSKYAEAISIIYPRKTNDFADDLYPHTAGQYSTESASWAQGKTITPQLISMKDQQIIGAGSASSNNYTTEIKPVEKQVPVVVQQKPVTQPITPTIVTQQPAQPKEEHVHHSTQPSTHNTTASPQAHDTTNVNSSRNIQQDSHQAQETITLHQELNQKDNEIVTLTSDISSKDALIGSLKEQLAESQQLFEQSLQSQRAALDQQLATKDTQINQLIQSVELLTQQVNQITLRSEQDVNHLQSQIDQLRVSREEETQKFNIARQSDEQDLAQLRHENEELKAAVYALQASVQQQTVLIQEQEHHHHHHEHEHEPQHDEQHHHHHVDEHEHHEQQENMGWDNVNS